MIDIRVVDRLDRAIVSHYSQTNVVIKVVKIAVVDMVLTIKIPFTEKRILL